MEDLNKSKKKIYMVTMIGLSFLLIIGAICIFLCLNSKDRKDSSIESQESVSAKTTNIIKFVDIGTYQIKLGNKIVDVVVSGESTHRKLIIDNKKIDIPFEYIDELYIINNEIIVISQSLGSEMALYFYDSDINNISADFKYENSYTMKPIYVDKVEENTLTVKAMNESVLNNYSTGNDLLTFCKNIDINNYKDQLSEAKYEIKYLGNGSFTTPKRIEEKYINEECQRVIGSSIENSKVINARSNSSYKIEKENRNIPLTISINSTNDKEAILTINYDSEYVKKVYNGITEVGIKEYIIKFDKSIKQVFIGNGIISTGAGNETVFYLLEDGMIEYTPIAYALGYDFKAYKCTGQIDIKSFGQVNDSISDVTSLAPGYYVSTEPYSVEGGTITLAERSDGYWYDLTNFLEKTPYYK